MRTLRESILNPDIADKANKQTSKILKYYKNLKMMYDVFWEEFSNEIMKKYDISNHCIDNTKTGKIHTRVAKIAFASYSTQREEFILDCIELFKSSYRVAFKKNPPKNILVINDDCIFSNAMFEYVNFGDSSMFKYLEVAQLGGLRTRPYTTKAEYVTVYLKYCEVGID